jgi:peroxiredoxin family protein
MLWPKHQLYIRKQKMDIRNRTPSSWRKNNLLQNFGNSGIITVLKTLMGQEIPVFNTYWAARRFMRNCSEEPHFVIFCSISHLGRLISVFLFFPQSETLTLPPLRYDPQAVHSCQMELVFNETMSELKSTVIRDMPSLLLKKDDYIRNFTKSRLLLLENRHIYIYIFYIYITNSGLRDLFSQRRISTVFWDMTPCNLAHILQRFLLCASKFPPDKTASHSSPAFIYSKHNRLRSYYAYHVTIHFLTTAIYYGRISQKN